MATAQDIITGALRRAKIVSAEIPIEASDLANGLEDLNDWASLLEVSTIALGFTQVSNATDEVNIPLEAVGMYKCNLAVYMSAQYGLPTDALLLNDANETMKQVLIAFAPTLDVDFPDTLPLGSGNQNQLTNNNRRFFNQNQDTNF